MRLYLASTSPARLATLRSSGIEPVLLPSNVDEDAALASAGPLDAPSLVLMLARLKAEAVVGRLVDGEQPDEPIDGFILGGDSMFEVGGELYGKPLTASVARERWMMQRGRSGLLHSGHWLIDHRGGTVGNGVGAVSTATVHFAADITNDEIDAYIATGEPQQVAGAFTIDSRGAAFVTSVEGDPHAVVGLSLATLRSLLLEFGIHWPSLWNRDL